MRALAKLALISLLAAPLSAIADAPKAMDMMPASDATAMPKDCSMIKDMKEKEACMKAAATPAPTAMPAANAM